jgi:hypothetical protein
VESTPGGPVGGYRALPDASPAMALAAASKLASRFVNRFDKGCYMPNPDFRRASEAAAEFSRLRDANEEAERHFSIKEQHCKQYAFPSCIFVHAYLLADHLCQPGLMQVSVAESQRDEAIAQLKEYKAEVRSIACL